MDNFLSIYLKVQNVSHDEVVVFWPILSIICMHTWQRKKMKYKYTFVCGYEWIQKGVCTSIIVD